MPLHWTFTYSMPYVPVYKNEDRDLTLFDLYMDLVISVNHLVFWKLSPILPNPLSLSLLFGQCVFIDT